MTTQIETPSVCSALRAAREKIIADINVVFKNINYDTSSDVQKIIIHKFKSVWPLRVDFIQNEITAWNFHENERDTIAHFFIFIIKLSAFFLKNESYFSRLLNNNYNSFNVINYILYNDKFRCLFWSDVKKNYSDFNLRKIFFNKYSIKNIPVILFLEEIEFKIKAGINSELEIFLSFIEDIYNKNSSLIVFSKQKLTTKNTKNNQSLLNKDEYSFNFKGTYKKTITFKAEKRFHNLSLHEAVEPILFYGSDLLENKSYINPVKSGLFDRLLELLSSGQEIVDKIQQLR